MPSTAPRSSKARSVPVLSPAVLDSCQGPTAEGRCSSTTFGARSLWRMGQFWLVLSAGGRSCAPARTCWVSTRAPSSTANGSQKRCRSCGWVPEPVSQRLRPAPRPAAVRSFAMCLNEQRNNRSPSEGGRLFFGILLVVRFCVQAGRSHCVSLSEGPGGEHATAIDELGRTPGLGTNYRTLYHPFGARLRPGRCPELVHTAPTAPMAQICLRKNPIALPQP